MPEKTKILVVDDDVNFCGSLSKILAKKGYEISRASSGQEALKLINEKAFDITLMDIKMPVMDGLEAYKRARVIRPGIRVILMSAFSVDELVKDALKDGVCAIVRKPFDIDMIINTIERAKMGMLIAIIDDDPAICSTMNAAIGKKGYNISICHTSEEAISLAKKTKHDIYFIDMQMPVLSGAETYLEIKKIDPKATVVIMTPYRHETDALVKQIIDDNAYVCLHKPFSIDTVLKIIDDVSEKIHGL